MCACPAPSARKQQVAITLKTLLFIISPLVDNDRSRRFPVLKVEPIVVDQLLRSLFSRISIYCVRTFRLVLSPTLEIAMPQHQTFRKSRLMVLGTTCLWLSFFLDVKRPHAFAINRKRTL